MKVALVHMRHRGTGGTERYLEYLAAHLARAGHDVAIVCRTHESAPHPSVRFVRLHSAAVGGAWRMWAFAQDVERHVVGAGYDVVLGLGKTWTHDVVRLGGGCHATYLELAGERKLAFGRRLKDRVALRIEKRALAPGAYRRVIANSDMVRRDVVRRYGVPPEAIEVVHNGVDLERFRPELRASAGRELRRAAGFAEDDLVVLFLGTGYVRKGLDRVLDAFPEVARERPRARLLVAGYDSARGRFEDAARAAGLAAKVCFLGGRRDPEACFAAADLYVLPTRYDPFANSTLEALASGLPVITTDANGASELIEPGVGSVVTQSDRDALARELLRWTSPGRAPDAAVAARALAERHGAARMAARSTAILEAATAEAAR